MGKILQTGYSGFPY